MGCDKLSLRVDGVTLLERAAGVLREVFDDVLVVTNEAERAAGLAGVRVMADIVPGIGPLGGIHAALAAAGGDGVFVVAADMPRLDAGVIGRQVARWPTVEADALVPRVDGRAEPLHAVYSNRCLPAIERQMALGEYGVRAIFEHIRVAWWTPDAADAACFANVNTPAEWSAMAGESRRAKRLGEEK